MSSSITQVDTGVSSLHYPRTGKRGVPQQFPRRLYEMLQSETKLIEGNPNHPKIIFWSESGRAFRIANVADFSATILPKYFRTKKFSSFQRNLNLYGFSKVRRGPETDMYAHPSFMRDQPESLSKLRKLASTSSRRRREAAADGKPMKKMTLVSRSVSPSPTLMLAAAVNANKIHAPVATRMIAPAPPSLGGGHVAMQHLDVHHQGATPSYASPKHTPMWTPIHQVPPSPDVAGTAAVMHQPLAPAPPKPQVGRGKLDLLAFAMEQAAAMQS